jgi:hypothetical protein
MAEMWRQINAHHRQHTDAKAKAETSPDSIHLALCLRLCQPWHILGLMCFKVWTAFGKPLSCRAVFVAFCLSWDLLHAVWRIREVTPLLVKELETRHQDLSWEQVFC